MSDEDTRYQTHVADALWHLSEAVRELGNARETARAGGRQAGFRASTLGPSARLLEVLRDLAELVPREWRDAARKKRKR